MDELKPKSRWTERLLAPFAKVEKGEAGNVVLLTLTVFLIMCGYYVLKTSREGLILTGGTFGLSGPELKTYSSGAMAIVLAGVVPAYGALANKVSRIKLINVSYFVVLACLVVFFFLGTAGVSVGLPFFIWLGLVNMFLVAQFWSFANDMYNEEQGKRLFAIIAVGGSIGSIVGPKLTSIASTYPMMLIAAGILLACIALFNIVDRRQSSDKTAGKGEDKDKPIGGAGGFELLAKDRYLMLMAVMILLLNLVNTIGEYILSDAAAAYAQAQTADKAAQGEVINEFYADFFFWVNLVSFLIQAFVVSRVIKYIGVRAAMFVLPVIALGTYGSIALIGGLTLTRVSKVIENGTNYSLQNTVRQALFLPTSRAAKYKAKAAIDTFIVRFGDTLSAIFVGFGIHAFGLGPKGIAVINLGLIALWLVVAVGVAREHKKLEDKGGEADSEPATA